MARARRVWLPVILETKRSPGGDRLPRGCSCTVREPHPFRSWVPWLSPVKQQFGACPPPGGTSVCTAVGRLRQAVQVSRRVEIQPRRQTMVTLQSRAPRARGQRRSPPSPSAGSRTTATTAKPSSTRSAAARCAGTPCATPCASCGPCSKPRICRTTPGDPDEAVLLLRSEGVGAGGGWRWLIGLGGDVDAGARRVVGPVVVGAGEAVIAEGAEGELGSAMDTEVLSRGDALLGTPEDKVAAEEARRGGVCAGDVGGASYGEPLVEEDGVGEHEGNHDSLNRERDAPAITPRRARRCSLRRDGLSSRSGWCRRGAHVRSVVPPHPIPQ
jgi:hypothetical protein